MYLKINEEELKACAKIEYDCWRENFAPILNISDYLYYQTETSIRADLTQALNNKNTHLLVTRKKIQTSYENFDIVISGFAIVRLDPKHYVYVIDKFFIAPQYQNEGIGNSLLKIIIKNFNTFSISVSIFKENRAAAHLLVINNFRQTANRKFILEYGKNKIPIPQTYYLLERRK